jgi:hypothetical protein
MPSTHKPLREQAIELLERAKQEKDSQIKQVYIDTAKAYFLEDIENSKIEDLVRRGLFDQAIELLRSTSTVKIDMSKTTIIQEVSGQGSVIGDNANVHDNTYNQILSQSQNEIDLPTLLPELEKLWQELNKRVATPDQSVTTANVALALQSAKEGNADETRKSLGNMTLDGAKWVLGVAKEIAVDVVPDLIKSYMGLSDG